MVDQKLAWADGVTVCVRSRSGVAERFRIDEAAELIGQVQTAIDSARAEQAYQDDLASGVAEAERRVRVRHGREKP